MPRGAGTFPRALGSCGVHQFISFPGVSAFATPVAPEIFLAVPPWAPGAGDGTPTLGLDYLDSRGSRDNFIVLRVAWKKNILFIRGSEIQDQGRSLSPRSPESDPGKWRVLFILHAGAGAGRPPSPPRFGGVDSLATPAVLERRKGGGPAKSEAPSCAHSPGRQTPDSRNQPVAASAFISRFPAPSASPAAWRSQPCARRPQPAPERSERRGIGQAAVGHAGPRGSSVFPGPSF